MLPLAQHRHGGVHMALFADVHASLHRQARGIHDRPVVAAVQLCRRATLCNVQGAGTVTALAPNTGVQLGVLAFEVGKRRRIAGVTRDAAVGQQPVEPPVVVLVARTEIPAALAIPREGKLEETAVLLGEVAPPDLPTAHHVVHATAKLVRAGAVRPLQVFDLIQPIPFVATTYE